MGIKDLFRKKGDVVDLSDLQKRGIYKPKQEKKQEVIDLSSPDTEEASPLGFLGSFASSSNENSNTISEPNSIILDSGKKQRLKGILRDLKVQMKNTGDKVYKVSDRLDLLEKKLERIERRVGL